MPKNALKSTIFLGLFLIPFVPFLVSSSFFFPFITTKAFVFRIIIEIVFAAWILLAIVEPEYRLKKSRLLYAILAFTVAVGLADLFGVAPLKSFWSNFERMEGFVAILHLLAFFAVISSVFREADWKRWWNASLAASFIMVLYCGLQLAGLKNINQGGVRVDGTFGNAIYLAVYMLFHIFIALWFAVREWGNRNRRWLYLGLIFFQVVILYYTATRGTVLGLLGGLLIFSILNVRNREERWARKLSVSVLAAMVLFVGGFVAVRNAQFVRESPVLSRFATLNLSELRSQGRYYVWPMAWKGIKERPILGWGQENFNYIFQKYYRPEMYNLEPWFDRAHNVFLDWAVAGGLVALLLYLSLYVFALLSIWRQTFSYTEKSVLTSLIAAYFFHNLFVFDHLFSYLLFFSLLAYLHGRSGGAPLWQRTFSHNAARRLTLPVVILLAASLYFVNWKPLKGNLSLIETLVSVQSGQFAKAIGSFERAYVSSPLGRQEASEQMVTYATNILSSSLPVEERNSFFRFAKSSIIEQAEEFSGDVRPQMLAGIFFTGTGSLDEAARYFDRAKALAPAKQEIYFQAASAYLARNESAKALADLSRAYELAPEYARAKTLYFVGAIYVGNRTLENQLKASFGEREFAFDDSIVSAYFSRKRFAEVIQMLETRKRLDPGNAALYDDYISQVRSQ